MLNQTEQNENSDSDIDVLSSALRRIGVKFFILNKGEFAHWDDEADRVLCLADSKRSDNKYFSLGFNEFGQHIK